MDGSYLRGLYISIDFQNSTDPNGSEFSPL